MKSKLRNLLIKYCTKKCKTGEETFGAPELADGAENTPEVEGTFLSDELEMENAANIEFQRAHRIGKKKAEETRLVIVRFLRFPERELILRRVRELADDIEGLRGFSYRDKRRKKKQKKNNNNNNSGHVLKKQERRDRKIAFLANQNLINYLSMGILFPSR